MGEYALKDDFILPGSGKNAVLFGAKNKFPGYVWVVPGLTQYTDFNPSCELGRTAITAVSVYAQMRKDGYEVRKVDEWIEVTPHHAQYYQLVVKQREDIEAKIREGLIRISQSLTDIELLEHDIRKYERYLELIRDSEIEITEDDRKKAEKGDKEAVEKIRRRKTADAALKTIFVDQVDYNAGRTGQGPGRLSMALMRNANIFPTIVDDFLEMESFEDLETGKLSSIPTVEKNLLKVKFKYFLQWKSMFKKQVETRLERLKQMHRSRMRSLEEFKEWVKPYFMRLKNIRVGYELGKIRKGVGMESPFRIEGEALAVSSHKIWAWRALTPAETFRETGELKELAKLYEKYEGEYTSPLDDFTLDVLIFGTEYGLINEFPWLTYKWVKEKAGGIAKKIGGADFWTFVIINVTRAAVKNPKAGEFEDTDWEIYAITMTSNALLVKLLEAEARDQEIEFYIDEMLGREVELKKVDNYIGYVQEDGYFWPVKEGKKAEVAGEKKFASFKEMLGKMKGDFRPVPAETIYYKRKGGKYVIGGKEYEELDDFIKKRKKEAEKLPTPLDRARHLSFLLKPEKAIDIKEVIKDWTGIELGRWWYRRYGKPKYEIDFFDRITQYYLVPTGMRWGGLVGMIKSKFGV